MLSQHDCAFQAIVFRANKNGVQNLPICPNLWVLRQLDHLSYAPFNVRRNSMNHNPVSQQFEQGQSCIHRVSVAKESKCGIFVCTKSDFFLFIR